MATYLEYEDTSTSKRQRKANYCDFEVRVLLKEVMLAKEVLFSPKLPLKVKHAAWEKVALAVNKCGIAKRTRAEVRDKWKAIKLEVQNREKRAMQNGRNGGGEITSNAHESNLDDGLMVLESISFNKPSVPSQPASTEPSPCWPQTVPPVLPPKTEESTPKSQDGPDCGLFETLNQASPDGLKWGLFETLNQASQNGPKCDLFETLNQTSEGQSPSADTTSLTVNSEGQIVVSPLNDSTTGLSSTGGVRKTKGLLRRKFRKANLKSMFGANFPSDTEERGVFLEYLKSGTEKNKAKTLLFESRNRRELLEIEKLEKELGKNV